MSESYAGLDVWRKTVAVTDDGNDVAFFSGGARHLGDRTQSLHQARVARADLAVLRAIDTTSLVDGTVRSVSRHGLFYFDRSSIETSEEPWVVVPTTGPGRWLACVPHVTSAKRIVQATVVAGITFGGAILSVNRNVAVDFIPLTVVDINLFRDGQARHGQVNDISDGSAGFLFPITAHVIDGAILSKVRCRYAPASDHLAVQQTPAAFAVRRVSRTLGSPEPLLAANNGFANDPAATVDAVNAEREWSLVTDQNNVIDLDQFTYDIVAFYEGGDYSRVGGGFVSWELTFTGRISPRALPT